MLEQMSESGTPNLFVFGTYVIPNIYSNYGNRVVFVENHVKTIGQCLFFERDGDHLEKTSTGSVSVARPILRWLQ